MELEGAVATLAGQYVLLLSSKKKKKPLDMHSFSKGRGCKVLKVEISTQKALNVKRLPLSKTE